MYQRSLINVTLISKPIVLVIIENYQRNASVQLIGHDLISVFIFAGDVSAHSFFLACFSSHLDLSQSRSS
jgi:hypothetical protein